MKTPYGVSWVAVLMFAFISLHAGFAGADDRVTIRGNYYREESTRVLAPEVQFSVDVPDERLTLGASYLLDAVSSASIATGTADATGGDNVFTELRHQAGVRVASKLDVWRLGAFFHYTTETDYVGRSIGLNVARSLLTNNIELSASYAYNFDRIFRIFGGGGRRLIWCGGSYGRNCDAFSGGTNLVQTHYGSLGYTHTLHRTVLLLSTLEYAHVRGPQDNPYRGMLIPNAEQESHPLTRNRFAWWISTRWHQPKARTTIEPRYRVSTDDWGVTSHAIDTRLHWRALPHLRVRFRYRFYIQSKAAFFEPDYVYEAYDADVLCTTKTTQGCASADPKLAAFTSHTPGVQLTWELDGLAERTNMAWLEGAWVQATYNYVHQSSRFGPARALGSLAVSFAF